MCCFEESAEEGVGGWDGDIKVEGLQNIILHLQHIMLQISPLSEVNQISDLRWIDFLVFGGYKDAGHSHQP